MALLENVGPLLQNYKIPIILGFFGIILVVAGVLFFQNNQPSDKVEIIPSDLAKGEKTITVDVEGSVEKPGIYSLPSGSRIDDLLVAAGGLSTGADREWVEKNLNRAQKLVDGAKIYIPGKGESLQLQKAQNNGVLNAQKGLINVNTASQSELEALWGIGPVTAKKIIENRPYSQVDDLLTKKILKSNVYQGIANQLTTY